MTLKYTIIIGDSRSLKDVESNSVSYIATSPPYWTLDVFSQKGEAGWERDLSQIKGARQFFDEIAKVWAECFRVLKPGGYFTCEWEDFPPASRFYGYPREICLAGPMISSIEKSGLYLISRVIWKKFQSGVALTKFQYTMYDNLRESDPRAVANWAYVFTFKKKELVKSSKRLDFNRVNWKDWSDGVWYIEAGSSGVTGAISGGAVFPVELVERLIRIYSYKGDLVLDPFGGTGTTMKAARNLGRSCTICEALPRMLPVIKEKVGYGIQSLTDEQIEWKVVE